MPILIYLKNPPRVLPIEGSIDPENKDVVRQYEEMYGRGTLVTKTVEGNGIVIPAVSDINIAFLQEVSEEEYEEMERKRKAQQEVKNIRRPNLTIPNIKSIKKN